MNTLLLTCLIALGLAALILLCKVIELRFGVPKKFQSMRNSSDQIIMKIGHDVSDYGVHKGMEMKEAFSRIPHLIIHLAYVLRDKLRVRFAHYIDEVKGRKPIKNKASNSEYLNAMMEQKNVGDGGEIH